MPISLPVVSLSLLVLVATGCASAPGAPKASSTAVMAIAPAAPVPAPGAAPEAPIGPAVAATSESATLAQSAHELGYTRKVLDKTVYYCKADATIGTRLSSTKCYTEDQMSGVVQRSIASRQSVTEMEHKTMNQTGGS